MPEQQPNKPPGNIQTIFFMVVLSFVCALILSVLASALAEPKDDRQRARPQQADDDRRKDSRAMKAIFSWKDERENMSLPNMQKDGVLVPGTTNDIATQAQLLEIYQETA